MENFSLITDFIIWGVGFVITQITLFLIFIYRMNIKEEIMHRENELTREDNKTRNHLIDSNILELKADLEDHRIALDKRIDSLLNKTESNAIALTDKQDSFKKANDEQHKEIIKSIDFVKNGVNIIGETVAYVRGVLDQPLDNARIKPRTHGGKT